MMTIRTFAIRRPVGALAAAVLLACSVCTARAEEPQVAPAVITLTSDGRILFRGEAVALDHLEATMRAAGIPPRPLTLRADEKLPFSTVARVLDILSEYRSSHLDAPGPGYREQLKRLSR